MAKQTLTTKSMGDEMRRLPSWIKDEGTVPIHYFQPWLTLLTGLVILAFLTQKFLEFPSHLLLWIVVPCGLVTGVICLYQTVWITPTGVAWRTLKDKGWVHWNEITSVNEVIGSRFVPFFALQKGVFHLPTEKVSLQRIRQILSSRPRLEGLKLPAAAEVPDLMSSTAPALLTLGGFLMVIGIDPSSVPFGMTTLRYAAILLAALMTATGLFALLSGAPYRWRRTIKITEEELHADFGSTSTTLKFADVRRAEMVSSANGPIHLVLESVAARFVLPYETPNFDQWKAAISARLPEGVVITDG